jgi:hypothetical protein
LLQDSLQQLQQLPAHELLCSGRSDLLRSAADVLRSGPDLLRRRSFVRCSRSGRDGSSGSSGGSPGSGSGPQGLVRDNRFFAFNQILPATGWQDLVFLLPR